MEIRYEHASEKYAESFGAAVDAVARERKYLVATTGFPPESTIEFVRDLVENNLAQYFALDGETVVGWCDALPMRSEGFRHVGVLGMGVLPGHRGRGIGTKLIRLTIKHAKKVNGLEKIELQVYKSNATAISLYEKAGFFREGERIDARKLDGRYDNLVLMGLKL
ncbi:MAG: GNAT family N-acetyltransferase [Spirochaetales bacterium]|nr:GNAT family N-acetyltransferase [Spirochaetales bacterium]